MHWPKKIKGNQTFDGLTSSLDIFTTSMAAAGIQNELDLDGINLIPYLKHAGLIALALNIATILIGFITAKLAKLNLAQSLTISIESGIQNGTMAIAIASGILMNENYAIAPAIYSLIMFFSGGAIIAYGMKFIKTDG